MTVQSGAEQYQPADDEPAPRHARRKNRNRWCKGKAGREHQPVVEEDTRLNWLAGKPCWTPPERSFGWGCKHHLVCANCGKELLSSWSEKFRGMCPEAPPSG